MHNNYYFLRQLTPTLRLKLLDTVIEACFSQEKDELLLHFRTLAPVGNFYVKAILTAQFSALSFPEHFNRARANSVNLFSGIIGEKVVDVAQHQNERSFYMALTNGKTLLFKMFGNRANVVYYEMEVAKDLFHKKFARDFELNLQHLHRQLLPTKAEFLENLPAPEKIYPTFGDLPLTYLHSLGYEAASPEQKWALIQQVIYELENPRAFYLTKLDQRTRLSLLPLGELREQFNDPIVALQEFVRVYQSETSFEKMYRFAHQNLSKQIQNLTQYLVQTQAKLKNLQQEASYSQTADVIMANLTNIPDRAETVTLFDFYLNQDRIFKLKPTESPQKFAERLYKKSKNQQIEINQLQERIQNKEDELLHHEIMLQELTGISDYKALKAFIKENLATGEKAPKAAEEPFRVFTTGGYKILVGKSAKNNDELTQKYTHKEDLWLHAKDVAGSHVVVKQQAGKPFPAPVIEKAAQLAAWYSKRKTDSLCPVLYTPKKFVRKPKGAAPGQVIVEREKVLLVKPGNPFERSYST
jgi:predicted ribosome quality control (RQC) complex YloA/Tae2 family protein